MPHWQYRKINLNDLPRKIDDIDMLNDAGANGWELLTIIANNFAYLKRQVEDRFSTVDADTNGDVATVPSHEVKAKYRDPKTNETWSGRGRMATWLKRKEDAGEDIEEYLV